MRSSPPREATLNKTGMVANAALIAATPKSQADLGGASDPWIDPFESF
jgi:hypothetical protein